MHGLDSAGSAYAGCSRSFSGRDVHSTAVSSAQVRRARTVRGSSFSITKRERKTCRLCTSWVSSSSRRVFQCSADSHADRNMVHRGSMFQLLEHPEPCLLRRFRVRRSYLRNSSFRLQSFPLLPLPPHNRYPSARRPPSTVQPQLDPGGLQEARRDPVQR